MRAALFALLMLFVVPVAAQTPPPGHGQGLQAPMNFEQFRARQLEQLQRAEAMVAQRLAQPNLTPEQRERLTKRKANLDRFAAAPPERKERILRRRFVRIDTDHDGIIDANELAAWRAAHQARAHEHGEEEIEHD